MPKKPQWYYYETYEGKDGSIKERPLTKKRQKSLDFDWDNVSKSHDKPALRKKKREFYESGLLGISDKTGAADYADTVEWGKQGGRPLKWKNETERKKVARLKKKIISEKPLKEKQMQTAITYNLLPTNSTANSYSPNKPRPGSYKYYSDRPATPQERKARWKRQQEISNS